MNTLTIKDLSITEQLDSKAMSAVRGGTGHLLPPSYLNFAPIYAPNFSRNVDATQLISTTMNIQSVNGSNGAFIEGATTNLNPHVTASNNIYMP
ncbi:hypothetical protein SCB29_08615 [Paraburkholderia sp. SIMBA_055]|jgi:hypothetical protein|uniref:Uncharacterized protein n=2 Tax=Paraburkholderia graminis TaxID=60548 RepID=B1FU33_PARG4|nr:MULTISPECIES: hypothetical protein [Paraburkholderia]AXF11882.1 hypothetical protein CUJ91_29160 [Paraburkholderia graminis]EDT12117.1 conserved hypothetical protein [Paraburkholderia graminis C4D1M]MDQ0626771.1 hypothetical protein [Paraburkholderia graminis]MDR6205084.1 hypothetical protein [Paraburkholderia graminis]MDR6471066.1 hypothetical protein [Paraburkholderia graminis]